MYFSKSNYKNMFQGDKIGFDIIHFLASITLKHWELSLVSTKQENYCELLFTELLSDISISLINA